MALTPQGVARGFALFVGILGFLYFFLVGLNLLGEAFKILAGDSAGSLFTAVDNPIAGLMVGILATVLVQSSSTTTSIIVSAVGSGVLPVPTAIPMIFGANIGTSVTNTIVSVGFVGDREQYRRGFAGATVHDMFNYMNVCFWLPVEVIISAMRGGDGGPLFLISEAIAKSFTNCSARRSEDECEKWEGPLKIITSELSAKFAKADKDVISDFSKGRPDDVEICQDLCVGAVCDDYKFKQERCTESPLATAGQCVDDEEEAAFPVCINENTLNATIAAAAGEHYDGFILNTKGVFFDAGMSDTGAGITVLILSIIVLTSSLLGMVKLLGIAVRGAAEDVMKKGLHYNGYLSIVLGACLTMFVQSSSITTSTLTPLVAIGTLSLEGMLPWTLGANIGTTLTGVLAALVGDKRDGFQIAIVHVLFNVFGVILFYPIPKIRNIPIAAARRLGDLAASFKAFPLFYILTLFLLYPGILLGISVGLGSGEGGGIAGGVVGLLFFIIFHLLFVFWYLKKGGKETLQKYFVAPEDEGKVAVAP